MIKRQDLSVLLVYYLGYSRIRNLILRLQKKPVTRFLAFHDVLPENRNDFAAKLVFLKYKTNVISIDDFFAGRVSTKKVNIVITFDDGYKSWITDVLPILKKLGLPAVFFVSSGFIGLSKDDEANYITTKLFRTMPPREVTGSLKETDVRVLVDNGFTIGGHTINHIDLAVTFSIDQLKHEIAEDKFRLECITGTNIQYFSYPTGTHKNQHINLTKLLRAIGYKGAVTTTAGFNTSFTNIFLLRRDITDAAMPHNVFKARSYGNYDAVSYIKQYINAFTNRIVLKS